MRRILIESFAPLWEIFRTKEAAVREVSEVFYEMMRRLRIEEQLLAYAEEFEQEGENALAKEYSQIYRIVMDLLDKTVELLGDERISIREYREILQAGLEASSVGVIPPGYDRVVVGDIERSRLSDVKVLFLAGANDGLLPKNVEHGGIISQSDRECFSKYDMEIAPTDRERSFIQNFYLYLNLTKPSEKLYITWFRVSQEGKETRRSYLVNSMRGLFPGVKPVTVTEGKKKHIMTAKSGLNDLVEGLKRAKQGDIDLKWAGLCCWYQKQEDWKEYVERLFSAAYYHYLAKPMGKDVTRALYGTVLAGSVTRLEKFSACAFSHFLQYGLRLTERDLGEFAPVDMGNLFHEALERYSAAMEEAGYHWFDVPREVQEALMQQAVERTIEAAADTFLFQDARTAYLVERIRRILRRTIETIADQIKNSHFTPEGYEVSFSFAENLNALNFSLSEEEKMRLAGRIDRLDTYKAENKVYVRIVDYKSGDRDFQLLSLYHGMQLQLVVYMNSAVELMQQKYPDQEVLFGGMYYYHLDDPVIDGDASTTDAEIKEKILEKLKLKGVCGTQEDASAAKKVRRADAEEFQVLSRFVNHKIQKAGYDIYKGDISVAPYQLGDHEGCDYCPYHGVCGFDPSMPGQDYRRLENIKDEDVILEKMRKEI